MIRLNYAVLKLIGEVHNFTLLNFFTNTWGFKKNGSWYGAVGYLVRNEVDVCISSLRWSKERYGIYDQTTYTYKLK